MQRTFEQVFRELAELDEHRGIEAKTATDIGRSFLETVCAFSNEPNMGGGYILLGVAPDTNTLFPSYIVAGVGDPDKLQSKIASTCATSFNIPVRPEVKVEKYEGKTVLLVYVNEVQESEKPVFMKTEGLPSGAFRRIGSSDVKCTDDDLIVFFQGRQSESFDRTYFPDSDLSDFDPAAVKEYRAFLQEVNPQAESLSYSDEELLRSIGCVKYVDGVARATLAGVVLFGTPSALRRLLPLMRVDYIRITGKDWVKDPDARFDTVEIRASAIRLIKRTQAAILDDIPKAFSLPAGEIQRQETPRIPDRAIREAVVNAVMHRDYRVHGPIQILRYSNRLEIRNPGYSLVSEDELGEPNSQTRNPLVAAVLHETRLAENKGSGIRAMRRVMEQARLAPPAFESDRDRNQFNVVFLFHHFLGEDDLAWLANFCEHDLSDDERHALVFVREIGAIDNKDYRSLNKVDTLAASGRLRHLRVLGLLDQKGKGARTYYVPTDYLLAPRAALKTDQSTSSYRGLSGGLPGEGHALSGKLPSIMQGGKEAANRRPGLPSQGVRDEEEAQRLGDELLPDRLKRLPTALRRPPESIRDQIAAMGRRQDPAKVKEVILQICSWKPVKAMDLGVLLNRHPQYLVDKYLSPMIEEGLLEYTIPDVPTHSSQAYRAASRPDSTSGI